MGSFKKTGREILVKSYPIKFFIAPTNIEAFIVESLNTGSSSLIY
jgi:hypothetical protein